MKACPVCGDEYTSRSGYYRHLGAEHSEDVDAFFGGPS